MMIASPTAASADSGRIRRPIAPATSHTPMNVINQSGRLKNVKACRICSTPRTFDVPAAAYATTPNAIAIHTSTLIVFALMSLPLRCALSLGRDVGRDIGDLGVRELGGAERR